MFSPGLTPPFNDVFKWRSSPLLPVPYTFFCYECYVDISLTQASFWYCMKYLPGQWRVLHRCESLSVPSQPLPPFAGEGLLHVRDRVCFPPPQRLSQEDQGFHCCQLPWTGISEIRIYKHKAISGRKYRLRWPGWNWFYELMNYGVTKRWWKTCVAFVGASANDRETFLYWRRKQSFVTAFPLQEWIASDSKLCVNMHLKRYETRLS